MALNLHRTSTTATRTTTRTTDAQLFLVLFTYKISCSRFTAFGFSGFCHFTKFRVRVVPTKGLVHTFPFLFENGDFFPPVWPSGENGHIFQKTLSGVEIFENAGFSFIYERSKGEVLENDDVINHMLLPLRMLCEGCCRISIVLAFSYERAKTIRIRYIWSRFQKYSDTCGWGLSE